MAAFEPIQREREEIDVANWTPVQKREVWPDLLAFIVDPCSAALVDGLRSQYSNDDIKAERWRRRRARAELAASTKLGEQPR